MQTKIRRYELINSIGEGAFGSVYKVIGSDKKDYAMKVTSIKENGITNLVEYNIMNRFVHPNIMSLSDYHLTDTKANLFMDLANTDLSKVCNKDKLGKPLSLDIFRNYSFQILLGICALHERKVIHNDIKPSNVLIFGNNISNIDGSENVRVSDFGLSVCLHSDDDGVFFDTGTMTHKAPEKLSGWKYGTKVDIWSLGCLFYDMLFGRPFIPPQVDHEPRRYLSCIKNALNLMKHPYDKINYALHDKSYLTCKEEEKPYVQFIFSCLKWDPEDRPTVIQLIENPIFSKVPRSLRQRECLIHNKEQFKTKLDISGILKELSKHTICPKVQELAIHIFNITDLPISLREYVYVCYVVATKLRNQTLPRVDRSMKINKFVTLERMICCELDFRFYPSSFSK